MVLDRNLLLQKSLIIAFSLILIVTNYNITTCKIVSVYIIMLSVMLLWKYRKNWKATIVIGFITWFNYSICMANILSPINNFFTGWKSDVELMVAMLNILMVFISLGVK